MFLRVYKKHDLRVKMHIKNTLFKFNLRYSYSGTRLKFLMKTFKRILLTLTSLKSIKLLAATSFSSLPNTIKIEVVLIAVFGSK